MTPPCCLLDSWHGVFAGRLVLWLSKCIMVCIILKCLGGYRLSCNWSIADAAFESWWGSQLYMLLMFGDSWFLLLLFLPGRSRHAYRLELAEILIRMSNTCLRYYSSEHAWPWTSISAYSVFALIKILLSTYDFAIGTLLGLKLSFLWYSALFGDYSLTFELCIQTLLQYILRLRRYLLKCFVRTLCIDQLAMRLVLF